MQKSTQHVQINIIPLSVNKAWKGRRFKTDEYQDYEDSLMLELPKYEIPEGPLVAFYSFGVSSKLSDNDNPIKPLQDVLQKVYGFNDSRIFLTIAHKELVPKGSEYIQFYFVKYTPELISEISTVLSMQG